MSDLAQKTVTITNHNKVHQQEEKKLGPPKQNTKREKIFFDVYSSYLQVNKSGSRDPGSPSAGMNLNQFSDPDDFGEDSRELTPMTRQPHGKSNEPIEEGTHQSAKKIGSSQIIKYLDLMRFKIEKCKNLTNGRQHNHKHCRYYHTDKDMRRVLDYS